MHAATPPEDRIQQQAAEWLTRRDAGWSAQEADSFARWRAADPRHETAVQRHEAAQALLRKLPHAPGAAAMLAELDALPARRRIVRFPLWARIAVAAAACVAVLFGLNWPRPPEVSGFVAAAGQPRTLTLSDGSTLQLVGGSRVEVRLSPQLRQVLLQDGEAHFAVAKDPQRPFVVSANGIEARAVGTAFGVRREPSTIEVVVTEGRVQVQRGAELTGQSPGHPILVEAGQGVVVSTAAGAVFPASPRSLPEVRRGRPAWHAPRLEFTQTPLAEVIARFNLHSLVELELGDPELADRPVGGSFNADQAEAFVNLLVAAGDIRVERVAENRLILRKAR